MEYIDFNEFYVSTFDINKLGNIKYIKNLYIDTDKSYLFDDPNIFIENAYILCNVDITSKCIIQNLYVKKDLLRKNSLKRSLEKITVKFKGNINKCHIYFDIIKLFDISCNKVYGYYECIGEIDKLHTCNIDKCIIITNNTILPFINTNAKSVKYYVNKYINNFDNMFDNFPSNYKTKKIFNSIKIITFNGEFIFKY